MRTSLRPPKQWARIRIGDDEGEGSFRTAQCNIHPAPGIDRTAELSAITGHHKRIVALETLGFVDAAQDARWWRWPYVGTLTGNFRKGFIGIRKPAQSDRIPKLDAVIDLYVVKAGFLLFDQLTDKTDRSCNSGMGRIIDNTLRHRLNVRRLAPRQAHAALTNLPEQQIAMTAVAEADCNSADEFDQADGERVGITAFLAQDCDQHCQRFPCVPFPYRDGPIPESPERSNKTVLRSKNHNLVYFSNQGVYWLTVLIRKAVAMVLRRDVVGG